ncbi:MAG: hypothetical protein HUJ70_14910 [Pseudobutyrivibrio sp.]|nr:hypothetical protein [Pseudobutyrivibrio sp.]
MCYYKENKEKICTFKAFVDYYAPKYYLDCEEEVKDTRNSDINRSYRPFETLVSNLLCRDLSKSLQNEDIFRILAWKIGGYDHKQSKKERTDVYKEQWNESCLQVVLNKKTVNISEYAEWLRQKEKDILMKAEKDITKGLRLIRNPNGKALKGIGDVYAITLLYFISRGKYPIYDRFVFRALYAIENNLKPGDIVTYEKWIQAIVETGPSKVGIYEKIYIERLSKLNSELGNTDYKNRDLDRALWVYGHKFKVISAETYSFIC